MLEKMEEEEVRGKTDGMTANLVVEVRIAIAREISVIQ